MIVTFRHNDRSLILWVQVSVLEPESFDSIRGCPLLRTAHVTRLIPLSEILCCVHIVHCCVKSCDVPAQFSIACKGKDHNEEQRLFWLNSYYDRIKTSSSS